MNKPIRLLSLAALVLAFLPILASPAMAVSGGPVVLMGIDAEDCGPGGHGPISVYESVVNDILSKVSNGGSGILVLGGSAPCITSFWDTIAADTSTSVTYANGASIATQSFVGFAMLAIPSDEFNTFNGVTSAENDLLAGRASDVAAHVNNGGGLLGLSSDFSNPYPYLGSVGAFTFNFPPQYDDITPSAEGAAIGISDALDICCWHDEYLTFPIFLQVLARNPLTGNASAIGGANVFISDIQLAPTTATNEVGMSHTLTATVVENNVSAAGKLVTFTVISGPHAGATTTGTTDSSGTIAFSYTGTAVGTDTVEASFVDSQGDTQTSNQVTAEWVPPPNVNPDCSAAGPSILTIWPPNHQFVPVNVLGVTDADGDPVTILVTSMWQDEPVDTYGDGRFTPDGRGIGTSTAEVRAERAGTPKVPGNGRVYHIGYTAEDGKGGACAGEVLVGVPHDQRGASAVDGGAIYDSMALTP